MGREVRQFVGWGIKSTRSVHPESIRRTKERACREFADRRLQSFTSPLNSDDRWNHFYDYAKANCLKVIVREK